MSASAALERVMAAAIVAFMSFLVVMVCLLTPR
jgi:hypothetical protein